MCVEVLFISAKRNAAANMENISTYKKTENTHSICTRFFVEREK